ncbi:hypothetical protein Nmel_016230 [Mimus melanotis]
MELCTAWWAGVGKSPRSPYLGQQWSPWSGGSGRSWRRTWGAGAR